MDEDDEDDIGKEETSESPLHKCTVSGRHTRVSPFEVRFSQMRARREFRNGDTLESAVDLINVVCLGEVTSSTVDEDRDDALMWLLDAPFPPIEVLQWRCKLRDEQTRRPRLDPKTGCELFDGEDRLFTLDNRRLYCLQKAAVALWPKKVVIDVIELPPGSLARMRELKKFRTLDRGISILVGTRREGDTLVRWSWREELGLDLANESEADTNGCHVQIRRRPRGECRSKKQPQLERIVSATTVRTAFPWSSFLTFLALYFLFRVGMHAVWVLRTS